MFSIVSYDEKVSLHGLLLDCENCALNTITVASIEHWDYNRLIEQDSVVR